MGSVCIVAERPAPELPLSYIALERAATWIVDFLKIDHDIQIRVTRGGKRGEPTGWTDGRGLIEVSVVPSIGADRLLLMLAHELGHNFSRSVHGELRHLGSLSEWGRRVSSSLWAMDSESLTLPLVDYLVSKGLLGSENVAPVEEHEEYRRGHLRDLAFRVLSELNRPDDEEAFDLLVTSHPEHHAKVMRAIQSDLAEGLCGRELVLLNEKCEETKKSRIEPSTLQEARTRLRSLTDRTCQQVGVSIPPPGTLAFCYSRWLPPVRVVPWGRAKPRNTEIVRVLEPGGRHLRIREGRRWIQSLEIISTDVISLTRSRFQQIQPSIGMRVRVPFPVFLENGWRFNFTGGRVTSVFGDGPGDVKNNHCYVKFDGTSRPLPVPGNCLYC